MFVATILISLTLAGAARAATTATLHQREQRQRATLWADAGTLRFFSRHPWLLHRKATRSVALKALRFARAELAWTQRELAQTRAERRAHLLSRLALPGWWLAQAACIRSHEGGWTSATGNGYYGAYQFLLSTWYSVGGTGYPSQATPSQQTYRAWLVWRRDGGSWREWGTRGACHV